MSDDVKLVKTLLDISLFEDLDYTQIQEIIDISARETVDPGTVLAESRTIDERLLILLDGRLRLESAAGDLLDYQLPVRILGEMGVFTGQIRSTRVVVEDTADILILRAEDLDEMLEEGESHAGEPDQIALHPALRCESGFGGSAWSRHPTP